MGTKLYSGTTRIYPHEALLRSANDFSTFTEKVTPISNDVLLAEDSAASYIKKRFKTTAIARVVGQSISSTNPNPTPGFVNWTGDTNWQPIVSYTATVFAGKYVIYACANIFLTPAHSRGVIQLNNSLSGQLFYNQYRTFAIAGTGYPAYIWAQDWTVTTDRTVTWTFNMHHTVGNVQKMKATDGNMIVWRIS